MLATDRRSAEIGNPDARKRSGKRKQNEQMEKFKELSIEEMQEENGGWVWGAIAVGVATTFLYEVVNDWENNVKAFNEGYESFKK